MLYHNSINSTVGWVTERVAGSKKSALQQSQNILLPKETEALSEKFSVDVNYKPYWIAASVSLE